MDDKYSELINTLTSYYNSNGMALPKNVPEYINNFPKGFSRQALKAKYGLNTSDIVSLINSDYSKSDAANALHEACSRLNYTLITPLSISYRSKDRVEVQCNKCGYINDTTLDSLRGSSKGCVKCTSGNLAWHKRGEELRSILLDEFDAVLVSNIPSAQTGYVTVRHLLCAQEYTTQLLGIVSPTTKLRGTCPNCRDSDKRVAIGGITFGSQFEADCYNILKPLNPEIHIKYSDYFDTSRRWVCDFKVSNFWIEVSNFRQDFKGYFTNIDEKRDLVEINNNEFFFLRSIKEVEEFVELFNSIKI